MKLTQASVSPVNVSVADAMIDGLKTLRVVKSDKLMEFDTNSYARINNARLKNGVLRVKLMSRLLPDAPDFARGFIGLAYHISDDDQAFESFYLRPTNARCEDPVRRSHGGQYFAYPTYSFEWLRARGITKYDCTTDYGLEEWVTLTAILRDQRAAFYLNDEDTPRLVVEEPLQVEGGDGVGLFIDIGTEGYFRDLEILPD